VWRLEPGRRAEDEEEERGRDQREAERAVREDVGQHAVGLPGAQPAHVLLDEERQEGRLARARYELHRGRETALELRARIDPAGGPPCAEPAASGRDADRARGAEGAERDTDPPRAKRVAPVRSASSTPALAASAAMAISA
jgi:hypothetical protein